MIHWFHQKCFTWLHTFDYFILLLFDSMSNLILAVINNKVEEDFDTRSIKVKEARAKKLKLLHFLSQTEAQKVLYCFQVLHCSSLWSSTSRGCSCGGVVDRDNMCGKPLNGANVTDVIQSHGVRPCNFLRCLKGYADCPLPLHRWILPFFPI